MGAGQGGLANRSGVGLPKEAARQIGTTLSWRHLADP